MRSTPLFASAIALALVAPVIAQTTTPAPAPAPAPTTTPEATDDAAPAATTGQATTGQAAPGATTGQAAPTAPGAGNPVVGGAEMLPTRNIVENASQSAEHRTLVRAVQAAELTATLSGPGPFTVFAPTDPAFAALPAGTLDSLLQAQNRPVLTQILTYHVVPGRITYADINTALQAGGGTATYTTVNGQPITIAREGNALKVSGQGGSAGYVGQYDVAQSNGVIHVINGVLVPNIQTAPAAGAPAQPGTTPAQPGTTPAQPSASPGS